MLSELQQKRVWEGMLGSEIRSKYFAELAGAYRKKQRWATWATLLFASSDAASFLATLPSGLVWIRMGLSICAAATSIYLALAENETKASECSELFLRWSRLQCQFRTIWEDTETDDVLVRLNELDEQEEEASQMAIKLPRDRKAMKKWQDHTEQEHHLTAVA